VPSKELKGGLTEGLENDTKNYERETIKKQLIKEFIQLSK